MTTNSDVLLIGYYGVDGACAVALGLMKHPAATVIITSAQRIGETFATVRDMRFKEIHICGTGVACDWDALEEYALAIKATGAQIYWHCGRKYLDAFTDRFSHFATPVFVDTGTNTAALGVAMGLTTCPDADFLMALAWFDKNVVGAKDVSTATPDQANWLDFIHAAMAQYFKYQDEDAYVRAIRKLVIHDFGPDDRDRVATFRRAGYQYLLHGKSPVIRQLKERIGKCAKANRNVLITGESGVGKEHVAHLLWEGSPQATGPFIAVNCAMYAGNVSLANSDLFGHVKGAFTGALQNRNGKLIEADGGVLFLDELSELPLEVQAKLLRVIEDGSIIPEGADRPTRQVHVRVLAASNRDLPEAIRSGAFRPDLYHRISTLRIHIPPLRERLQDLDIIVAEKLALLKEEGYEVTWKPKDLKVLRDYSWPGNVRQLLKAIERAVLLDMPLVEVVEQEKALGDLTGISDGKEANDIFCPVSKTAVLPMKEIQRAYAHHVWELFDGNYSAAARAMGIDVNTLRYSYLKE